MGKTLKKFTERIKEALVNPELDKVKAEVQAALEEMKKNPKNSNVTASLLKRGVEGLRKDLKELKISPHDFAKYERAYETRFRVATTNLEKEAILKSPETLQLNAFVEDYAQYTKLDEIIAECKKKDSKDPLKKFIQLVRKSSPLLLGIGAGVSSWLSKTKGEEVSEESEHPSNLETAVAKADQTLQKAKSKKGKKEKGKNEVGPKIEEDTKKAKVEHASYSGQTKASAGPRKSFEGNTKVETIGSTEYPINPNYSKKLKPEEFKQVYLSKKSGKDRSMFVLQQVAAGNASNVFEKLKVTGKDGITATIEVDRNTMRVADMPVPLDGPTAMAAAMLSGCTLPTPWLIDQHYKQAKKNKNEVKFIAYPQIAEALGIPDSKAYSINAEGEKVQNGQLMMSPEFVVKRNELLKKYRKEHGIRDTELTSGESKAVVHPVPGVTKAGRLEIYGGKDSKGNTIQGLSGGKHIANYADYSHGLLRVRNTPESVTVRTKDGKEKKMSYAEFNANPEYAKKFGFAAYKLKNPYLTPQIEEFIAKNKPAEKKKAKDKNVA